MEGEGEGRKGKGVSGQAREKRASRAPRFSLKPQTHIPFPFTQATYIVTVRNSKFNCVWSFSRKTLCGSILV